MEPNTENIIDARPTKEFFIYMLTKDIKLVRSIIDLVDNSWDGALRSEKDVQLTDLWIRLEVNETHFKISDNCGGMSYDLAKNYAFRFGRPKEMPLTHHSVGQFGVGMKRSLFKLGQKFKIESNARDVTFVIEEDVNSWVERQNWEFQFQSVKHFQEPRTWPNCGTTIVVTELRESVQAEFGSEVFITQLKEGIQAAHQRSIERGIAISLNGVPLVAPIAKLLQSAELKAARHELKFDEDTDSPVTVILYAGVDDSDPHAAGWSVFCNGRLVLDADVSSVTGWGEGNGRIIPRFHNQFARFRGYAFFDCDNAAKLPWNTTKTGVDSDSPAYQSVRLRMIEMMRPVIDFLNRIDAEKDVEPDERYLTSALDNARHHKLETLTAATKFLFAVPPTKKQSKGPRMRRIQYDRLESEIDLVKEALGVSTLKDVGEGTFDYFYDLECK